jgi:hypothetical protein
LEANLFDLEISEKEFVTALRKGMVNLNLVSLPEPGMQILAQFRVYKLEKYYLFQRI